MTHIEQYNRAIELCQLAGVPQTAIDNSFIPDETTIEEEVLGSIYMALQESVMDYETADQLVQKLYNEIHPETIKPEPTLLFTELIDSHSEEMPEEELQKCL